MAKRATRRPKQRPRQRPTGGAVSALATAVRRRRKALRLTQEDLARYAGCGLAFLYQLENAKPTVRLDKVLDVLEVLGLELRIEEGQSRLSVGPADLRESEG